MIPRQLVQEDFGTQDDKRNQPSNEKQINKFKGSVDISLYELRDDNWDQK